MAPLSTLFTSAALLATGATAFTTPQSSPASALRPSTKLYENFGFDFAEDQVENTPQIILGEANYKKWVNGVDPNNMLNRQVRRNCLFVLLVFALSKLGGQYEMFFTIFEGAGEEIFERLGGCWVAGQSQRNE